MNAITCTKKGAVKSAVNHSFFSCSDGFVIKEIYAENARQAAEIYALVPSIVTVSDENGRKEIITIR